MRPLNKTRRCAFRDVFSEVLTKHLGATKTTAAKVFPGYALEAARFRGILRS